jgi:toxin ParE1/3/4
MKRPYFSPSARRDLNEIIEYIARDKPGAAARHTDRLEDACRTLADNSDIGTPRDDLILNLRCFSVGNYVIYFRPTPDGIDVVRVLHGSRDETQLF